MNRSESHLLDLHKSHVPDKTPIAPTQYCIYRGLSATAVDVPILVAAGVEPELVGVREVEHEVELHATPVEVLTAVPEDVMFVAVGIAPLPAVDDTIGVGLGMFDVLL